MMLQTVLAYMFAPYILFGVIFFLCWYYSTYTYNFWKKRKIKFKPPVPFFGNLAKFTLLYRSYHECLHEIYQHFEDERFGGFFHMRNPMLLIRDPDLAHAVLVRDFKIFVNHGIDLLNPDKKLNPLSIHLFASEGDQWRALRRNLSPVFTMAKLKGMESQIETCVNKLTAMLDEQLEAGGAAMDIKIIFSRLSLDLIGSLGFGIDCNSLARNNEFSDHVHRAFQPSWTFAARILAGVFSKKLVKHLQLPDWHPETSRFFTNLVLKTIRHRRKNGIVRSDILQLLMNLQNAYDQLENAPENCQNRFDEDRFDETHIIGNSFLFFIAGFDTMASALTYCLYELSLNQNIQDQLRREVEAIHKKYNHCWNLEALQELPYLDAVVSESLRKYPPAPWIMRRAEEDWIIPGTDKVLPCGTNVMIPVWSIHNDALNFPNPEMFDPQRFLGENATQIQRGTYLPFGDGPRNCIGFRLAKLEIRIIMVNIILRYNVEPCSRTKLPLEYIGGSLLLNSKGGIWIKLSKREGQ